MSTAAQGANVPDSLGPAFDVSQAPQNAAAELANWLWEASLTD